MNDATHTAEPSSDLQEQLIIALRSELEEYGGPADCSHGDKGCTSCTRACELIDYPPPGLFTCPRIPCPNCETSSRVAMLPLITSP